METRRWAHRVLRRKAAPRFLIARLRLGLAVALLGYLLAPSPLLATLEIERPVRHWEFMGAVGPHAAVLGKESGTVEAWVYPLKLLSDLRLGFKLNGRVIPAESVVRSVIYRPGSTTLVYSGDYYAEHFLVRQTFIVPPDLRGALIRLDIESSAPLQLDASFRRDFTQMWPAGLGGTFGGWDESMRAFVMGEERGRFQAAVGSPDALLKERDYATNYSASPRSAFGLGTLQGKHKRLIALAASFESRQDLEQTYRTLLQNPAELEARTERHYQRYLERLPQVVFPDKRFERAYQWSMISMFKGLVRNPFLKGPGLVAGFGLSKGAPRPGFAWFFGRDSFWTTLALTIGGDLESARDAIRFIAQFQREDGKIPHEITQSAPFIPWFEKYPYAYASADSTPLYVIAVADYISASNDLAFLDESWPRLVRAVEFLHSTEDEAGFARNAGVGHGWVEGGPLLPVRTEFYQAGLQVEALRVMSELAELQGDPETANRYLTGFQSKRVALEATYWIPGVSRYAFAIDRKGKAVDQPGALATVPMWFGMLQPGRARQMVRSISGEDHISDWGSRLISSSSSRYAPAGYHFGSVWPLFTGWASVGEYRYHAVHPAYANLAANVGLVLDGSGGHTTEVLSGAAYSPLSTSSSHQIWSAAMVVSPLLRGMLGLEVDAPARRLALTPHLPAHWDGFEINRLKVGQARLDLSLERSDKGIRLNLSNRDENPIQLRFAPALAPSASVQGATYQGAELEWERRDGGQDWHPIFQLAVVSGRSVLDIRYQGDFGVTAPATLPTFGRTSSNLKILSEQWAPDGRTLELSVSGRPGRTYLLHLRGGAAVSSIEGGVLVSERELSFASPESASSGYQHHQIVIRLKP